VTLDQLRIFLAVAELEHVTRAAAGLNLTQSAVSAAVHALETGYQTKLFDRVGRRVVLTQAGAALVPYAQSVIDAARTAQRVIEEMRDLGRGHLFVHASQTIANHWLPKRLVQFGKRHPGIKITLSIGNTAQTARAVLSGAVEIGLVEGAVRDEALTERVIASDHLVIVVAPNHPWGQQQTNIDPSQILSAGWALREAGSGTRSNFEAALANRGIAPNALRVDLELPSNTAICAAVEASDLAGVVSESVAASWVQGGRLQQAPFVLPARDFALITHRARSLSAASAAFVALLEAGIQAGSH
jgi:DNA-binding transcriptional LysR family regulator